MLTQLYLQHSDIQNCVTKDTVLTHLICWLQGASVQLPPCPQLQDGDQGCDQHGGGAGRHGGARHHRGLRQAAPLQLQQVPRAAAVHRAQQDPRGVEVWHSVTIIIV